MKEVALRKWHRRLGIVVAPLLVLQAISGMILSIDWLLGIHQRIGEAIPDDIPQSGIPQLALLWNRVFVTIHYGFDVGGSLYHVALGIATIAIIASGFMIYLRIWDRPLKAGKK
jgi:uncharacterized iron-regulated membrane protein